MLSKFDVVFFDAGGTLLHPYPSVGEIYEKYCRKHGGDSSAADLEARFRKAWIHKDGLGTLRAHANEKVEKQWWRELVEEVFSHEKGIRNFEAFFDELYDIFALPEYWRLYPQTLDVLKELKKRGKKMGIVSNWDSRLFKICEGLGLDQYFDFIIASAVFGASKPSPKIFEEALKRSGAKPQQAVHIGDSLEDDIHGAGNVGIHAILIERHKDHREKAVTDVPVIHSLLDLLK